MHSILVDCHCDGCFVQIQTSVLWGLQERIQRLDHLPILLLDIAWRQDAAGGYSGRNECPQCSWVCRDGCPRCRFGYSLVQKAL